MKSAVFLGLVLVLLVWLRTRHRRSMAEMDRAERDRMTRVLEAIAGSSSFKGRACATVV